jgi:hypothetical protein
MRDPLRQVSLSERHAIQKPKGAYGLIKRRPRHPAGDEMDLEGTDVL